MLEYKFSYKNPYYIIKNLQKLLILIMFLNTNFKILSFFMFERENAGERKVFNPNYIIKDPPRSCSLISIVLFISIFAKENFKIESSQIIEEKNYIFPLYNYKSLKSFL